MLTRKHIPYINIYIPIRFLYGDVCLIFMIPYSVDLNVVNRTSLSSLTSKILQLLKMSDELQMLHDGKKINK